MLAMAGIGALRAQPTSPPQEIVLGQVVSRAKGLATTGHEIALGTRACADAVNASGGIRGRSLRLLSMDDGGDPAALLPRAKELLAREAIVALLTPMGRAANGELLPWAAIEGLSVVAPYGSGALATQAAALTTSFFLRTHPSVEALRLTTQLQTLGLARIAVLYSDDELGRETLAAFEEALASGSQSAMALLPLQAEGAEAALKPLAEMAPSAAPQALLLATTGAQTQAVLQALHRLAQAGRKIVPYALSSAVSQQDLQALGAAARWLVLSQVLPSPRAESLPLIKTYLAAWRRAGQTAPSYPSLEGCVAVLTLVQALKRSNEPPTRAGVLKALRSAGVVDLGGWSVDLADRQRPGSRFTDITLVGADGAWIR